MNAHPTLKWCGRVCACTHQLSGKNGACKTHPTSPITRITVTLHPASATTFAETDAR
jgi:hypothetical protein